jgi:hypothetical protein
MRRFGDFFSLLAQKNTDEDSCSDDNHTSTGSSTRNRCVFQINTGSDGNSLNSELFSRWEETVGVCFWQFHRIRFEGLKREGNQ